MAAARTAARMEDTAEATPRAGRRLAPALPLAVIALNLGLSLFTGLVTLRDFPNSGDESAYLISAQLFAEGRLSVPSPEPREFFDHYHVINDGRYYGRYPPGWPAILSLGVAVNAPWLVNPILGALTLFVLHRLARESFSREVADATLIATAANPFLIFNSASYFSHAACLLAATLFAWAALRCGRTPAARLPHLALGASAGAIFLIRPYTSVALGVATVGWLLAGALHERRLGATLKGLGLAFVPAALGPALYLAYNALQTGDPLLPPFLKYNPGDRPFASRSGWQQVLASNRRVLTQLSKWIPLSPLVIAAGFALGDLRRDSRVLLLLATFASLFVAHMFYETGFANEYGPRYLYEASFAVFLLIGCVVTRAGRWGVALLVAIVCLNVGGFVDRTRYHSAQVEERTNVYSLARERGLADAIVFLKAGPGMDRRDLTRNGIHFDQSVLYVLDLGERNVELLRAFPGRRAYVYDYDPETRTGHLTRYER
jgi:hypothetical protein